METIVLFSVTDFYQFWMGGDFYCVEGDVNLKGRASNVFSLSFQGTKASQSPKRALPLTFTQALGEKTQCFASFLSYISQII